MWYYLDKRGQPIEWIKGRRLSNFVRFLRYCRRVTTERPDSMYPYWLCSDCGYVEDYDGLRDGGIICPKCNKASMDRIDKKYRPLTPGTTQGGSKKPTDSPRPDVKVPAQVAKPKGKTPLFTAEHCAKIAEVFAKMFAIHDRYMAEGGSRLDEDSARHRRGGMTSMEKKMTVMLAGNAAGTFDDVKFHKLCEGEVDKNEK